MNIIGNNCCSGWLYKEFHLQFSNPFVWMVLPYNSILYLLSNFNKVKWNRVKMVESQHRKNTYVLTVDNEIQIHYVHYKFDPTATHLVVNRDDYQRSHAEISRSNRGGDVYYCRIWEYIYDKYKERVARMLELNEPPMFLIKDELYMNPDQSVLRKIAECSSPYKRIVITANTNITRDDDVVKTIHYTVKDTYKTVIDNMDSVKMFFNI